MINKKDNYNEIEKLFAETDDKIVMLDMEQRIRILEFVNGIRDISEVKDKEEAELVQRVICERIMGHISKELNPNSWHFFPVIYEKNCKKRK